MESVQAISNLDVSAIIAFLQGNDREFQPSQLYMPVDDEKVVDLDKRVSEFRVFTDEALFESAEIIVKQLSERSDTREYVLVRNDLTHIRYRAGGFFKRHQDFLSLATNMVEEHTLLLCVTPPDIASNTVGGATAIYGANDARKEYTETVTPGSALAFRKDVEHAGMPVVSGESAHTRTARTRIYYIRASRSRPRPCILFFERTLAPPRRPNLFILRALSFRCLGLPCAQSTSCR